MSRPILTVFKFTLLILILSITKISFSQDKAYALSCVKTLSSPQFHGRGFVKNGDRKSAKFIENELKKWGVQAFDKSYQQKFNFDINTISKAEVSLNTKPLVLGVDYLVFAASTGLKGEYKLYYPDSFIMLDFLKENHKNEVFVLDTFLYKSEDLINNYNEIISTCAFNNAVGIIAITKQNLVQTQRTYEFGFPFLQIKEEAWSENTKTIKINIKSKFKENYESQNVIGFIKGEIDSFFVFGAHYDHLGRVNKNVYFPGANDNASGVATILSLAKYYHDNNIKPKYNITFILFSAEEAGLIGSLYYTKHPIFALDKIKIMFNLDMVGTGVEGLSIVNGKENPKASELIQKINTKHKYFDDIKIGKGSANSDHHFFDSSGVPAIFLFTRGGPQYYHDILDRSETLELNKHNELIKMFEEFMQSEINFKSKSNE